MTYNTKIIIDFIDNFFVNKNKQNEEHKNNLNIKGKWGSGKTTYIEKLKDEINELKNEDNTNKYQVKIFNVWEYEISDNIFVSILCDILNLVYDIEKESENTKKSLKKVLKNLAFIAGYGLTYALDLWMLGGGAFLRGISNGKRESDKNTEGKNIDEKSDKELLFELIKTNKYYDLINDTLQIIKNLIGDKKYIIIFDELDRCTTPKMIEFLSIIKNVLFKLNNCFFIVSCDSDRVNKMLTKNKNENYTDENYTDKIFYNTINIEILSYFDNKIIYTENWIIKKYLSKLVFQNDFRKINKAINRAKAVISFMKKDEDDLIWYFFEFVAFWVYYKNIDLLKNNKNLSNLNLNLLFDKVKNKISNYTKGIFFKKNKDSSKKDEYEFLKIMNTTSDCFIRVYNENNNVSMPFAIFIPFIKDIDNFDIDNLCNVTVIENPNQYLSNGGKYLGDYLEYKNIYKYLEKDAQELFDEIFSYFSNIKYIELNTSINEYFKYMQNIM